MKQKNLENAKAMETELVCVLLSRRRVEFQLHTILQFDHRLRRSSAISMAAQCRRPFRV